MRLGPVQILVLSFEGNQFRGEILPELRRLRELDIVRLVDLLVVAKGQDGSLTSLQRSDLPAEEARQFGGLVSALLGVETGKLAPEAAGMLALDPEQLWDVGDAIPNGSAAAIALIEHRWAIPLRGAIERAGGRALADTWVHPDDLEAAQVEAAGAHP